MWFFPFPLEFINGRVEGKKSWFYEDTGQEFAARDEFVWELEQQQQGGC